MFTNPIIFSDGTSNPPQDVELPVNFIDMLPLGAKIWGWIETFLTTLAGTKAILYLRQNRSELIVIESQPVFMSLLAIGCIILGTAIIALTFETNGGCMSFVWLFSSGFTLSLASLTAKSVRVAILWYHRGPLKKKNASVRGTILLTGISLVLAIEFIILTIWQIVAPLNFQKLVTQKDEYGNPLFTATGCATPSLASSVFLYILIAYICLVVLITGLVAFWVRNAPEKYQEAKWTAISGVCIFQLFFIALPTTAAVWGSALPRFLVLSSTTFLLCMIILMTMFLPKAFHAEFHLHSSPLAPGSFDGTNLAPEKGGSGDSRGMTDRATDRKRPKSEVKAIRSERENIARGENENIDKNFKDELQSGNGTRISLV